MQTVKLILDECDSFLALKYAASPTFLFPRKEVSPEDHFVLPSGKDYQCANESSYELEAKCASQTELCHRFLDLTGPLQLGGLPEELLTAAGSDPDVNIPVQFYNFSGCISDVHVDHQLIDLNEYVYFLVFAGFFREKASKKDDFVCSYVYNNGTKVGCEPKMNYCSSNPCQRNAECVEGWGTYICNCPPGWGGKDCSAGQ